MLVSYVKRRIADYIEQHIAAKMAGEEVRFLRFLSTPVAAKAMAQVLTTTPTIWGDAERIKLANNVHLVNTLLNVNSGSIEIGENTFFGHNVSLLTGTHPIEEIGAARQTFPTEGRDIIIGSGVWVSTNAVILGPCTIGDNAVIAAGAIVLGGFIPPNTVYGGVPARLIKNI